MKDGIIRRKFNDAVESLTGTPEGKNAERVLGALKSVTLALRGEGFEATMAAHHGAAALDESFTEDYEADNVTASGALALGGETLPFVLSNDGYEGGDMRLVLRHEGYDILDITSVWDDGRKKWEDQPGEDAEEDDDEDDSPKRRRREAPTLEGRIADALIDVLAKQDFAARHTVKEDEGLEKNFKVPAQIKIIQPKGTKP